MLLSVAWCHKDATCHHHIIIVTKANVGEPLVYDMPTSVPYTITHQTSCSYMGKL